MSYKEIIERKFPNVKMGMSQNRFPKDVLEIDFKQLIQDEYRYNCFIDIQDISSIKKKLQCYLNSDSFESEIEKLGDNFCVELKKISFYQEKVEVERLTNVDQSKPVTLVKQGKRIILINGYHRVFLAMLENKKKIKSKIIDLPELAIN